MADNTGQEVSVRSAVLGTAPRYTVYARGTQAIVLLFLQNVWSNDRLIMLDIVWQSMSFVDSTPS